MQGQDHIMDIPGLYQNGPSISVGDRPSTGSRTATRLCPQGHEHDVWPTSGEIPIQKCERYCWLCGITVRNDASTLRKHVIQIHQAKQMMPIKVLPSTSGRKRITEPVISSAPILIDPGPEAPHPAESAPVKEFVNPHEVEFSGVSLSSPCHGIVHSETTNHAPLRRRLPMSRHLGTPQSEIMTLQKVQAGNLAALNQLRVSSAETMSKLQSLQAGQECQDTWITILSALFDVIGAVRIPESIPTAIAKSGWMYIKHRGVLTCIGFYFTINGVLIRADVEVRKRRTLMPLSPVSCCARVGISDHYWFMTDPQVLKVPRYTDHVLSYHIYPNQGPFEPFDPASLEGQLRGMAETRQRTDYQAFCGIFTTICRRKLQNFSVLHQNGEPEAGRLLPVSKVVVDLMERVLSQQHERGQNERIWGFGTTMTDFDSIYCRDQVISTASSTYTVSVLEELSADDPNTSMGSSGT
ncbi:hypothetical protein K491DRAFT_699077 [Lophiostoma macrostomum CBS 122681]|uniref:Uncharacterized protein n=1 Tax=Lophiostoma macrostomum CBS 122681 TaxID=1314788 RepID=A0A6A6SPY7_9PLEO|nr:hypothetical protein K491DRAFT_699077 [Lophiostoma macrostomum CBS 122681]